MELNLNNLDDVDQLMLNAQLRDEIAPYLDESITLVDTHRCPRRWRTISSGRCLAWGAGACAPHQSMVLSATGLDDPSAMDDRTLHQTLHQVIGRLFEKNIVLTFTEHLSDRELYRLIMRNILPAQENKSRSRATIYFGNAMTKSSMRTFG